MERRRFQKQEGMTLGQARDLLRCPYGWSLPYVVEAVVVNRLLLDWLKETRLSSDAMELTWFWVAVGMPDGWYLVLAASDQADFSGWTLDGIGTPISSDNALAILDAIEARHGITFVDGVVDLTTVADGAYHTSPFMIGPLDMVDEEGLLPLDSFGNEHPTIGLDDLHWASIPEDAPANG